MYAECRCSWMCSHSPFTPHLCHDIALISQAGGRTDHRSSTRDAVSVLQITALANHITAMDRATITSSLQISQNPKPWLPGCSSTRRRQPPPLGHPAFWLPPLPLASSSVTSVLGSRASRAFLIYTPSPTTSGFCGVPVLPPRKALAPAMMR